LFENYASANDGGRAPIDAWARCQFDVDGKLVGATALAEARQ
jgi:hypothetical protein